MTDCVLDASALVLATSAKTDEASALRTRLGKLRVHAPHLVDAEVGNVLRRHEHAGLLTAEEAVQAMRAARVLVAHRYAHVGQVGELAWTLRHNLSYYDALYVALAAGLDAPLITADTRLSRAPELPCTVELV
jgi:predicted nucleic acid-binding protein